MNDEDLDQDRREYESDPKKRLSLELWNTLEELEVSQNELFLEVCNKIIENAEYI